MSYFLAVIYLAGFVFLIKKSRLFNAPSLSRNSIVGIYLLKVIVGILLWAVYTFYYTDRSTADIYKFFDESEIIYEVAKEHPLNYIKMISGIADDTEEIQLTYKKINYWNKKFDDKTYNDSRLIIRFNALLRLVSMGNYHIHSMFMCFLSLIGFIHLYKAFHHALKDLHLLFIAVIFLLPSVLFWTSGVLKEGLLFFALGVFIYCYKNMLNVFRIKYLCYILLSGILLVFVKFYVFVSLIPALIAFSWVQKTNEKSIFLKYLTVFFLSALLAFSLNYFSKYDLPHLISKKQNDFITLAKGGLYLKNDTCMLFFRLDQIAEGIEFSKDKKNARVINNTPHLLWKESRYRDTIIGTSFPDTAWTPVFSYTKKAGSLMQTEKLEADWKSLLLNSPKALINSLLQPFPNAINSPFMLLALLENILLLSLLMLALFHLKIKDQIQMNLFLFCISFSMLLLLLIGLSTPVLGALVRYKIPALPFLYVGLLLLIDPNKLKERFPFLK